MSKRQPPKKPRTQQLEKRREKEKSLLETSRRDDRAERRRQIREQQEAEAERRAEQMAIEQNLRASMILEEELRELRAKERIRQIEQEKRELENINASLNTLPPRIVQPEPVAGPSWAVSPPRPLSQPNPEVQDWRGMSAEHSRRKYDERIRDAFGSYGRMNQLYARRAKEIEEFLFHTSISLEDYIQAMDNVITELVNELIEDQRKRKLRKIQFGLSDVVDSDDIDRLSDDEYSEYQEYTKRYHETQQQMAERLELISREIGNPKKEVTEMASEHAEGAKLKLSKGFEKTKGATNRMRADVYAHLLNAINRSTVTKRPTELRLRLKDGSVVAVTVRSFMERPYNINNRDIPEDQRLLHIRIAANILALAENPHLERVYRNKSYEIEIKMHQKVNHQ